MNTDRVRATAEIEEMVRLGNSVERIALTLGVDITPFILDLRLPDIRDMADDNPWGMAVADV